MELGEKLLELRRKKGMSQEQVANVLNVSRQTVSKWETGQSYPDFDKLVPLSELYQISLDELAGKELSKGEQQVVYVPREYHYEYKSKRTLFGLPLVHIHLGRGMCRAKGILAIGTAAKGVLSIGLFSVGLFSLGIFSVGLLSLGCITVGLLSGGALSVGLISAGGVAVGGLAVGGLAIGEYALGGCALGARIALGGYAQGHIAIGNVVDGAVRFLTDEHLHGPDPEEIRSAIEQAYPQIPQLLKRLFSSVVKLPG